MQPINSSLAVQQELILQKAAPAVDSFYIDCAAAQTITITHHFPFSIYLYMDGLFSIKKQACIWWYLKQPRPPYIFEVSVCVVFALQASTFKYSRPGLVSEV